MIHQRNFHRVDFHSDVVVGIEGRNYSCKLSNLALQGTLLESAIPLPLTVGSEVQVTFGLQSRDIELGFIGRLVHQEGNSYGFFFTESDSDSLAHLRRLLELNVGDDDLTASEFSLWLKQHA